MSYGVTRLASETRLGSPTAKAVLRFLAFVANDEGYGWPSNEYIAKNLEIHVRTVRRVLQVFGAIGLITRVDRGPHRVRGLKLNMSMLGGELHVEYTATYRQVHSIGIPQCRSDAGASVAGTPERVAGTPGGVAGTAPPHPHKGVTANEPSVEPPPLPPKWAQAESVSHDSGRVERTTSLERAMDQVMQGCGFTKRRVRMAIRGQILQRADAGDEPATVVLAMIDAWQRFQSQGMRLRVRWSPTNFFSEGHWRNSQGWHWDNEALREERLQAEARVGSWR